MAKPPPPRAISWVWKVCHRWPQSRPLHRNWSQRDSQALVTVRWACQATHCMVSGFHVSHKGSATSSCMYLAWSRSTRWCCCKSHLVDLLKWWFHAFQSLTFCCMHQLFGGRDFLENGGPYIQCTVPAAELCPASSTAWILLQLAKVSAWRGGVIYANLFFL